MQTMDEMRAQLLTKSTDDLAFRSRLLAEPRAVIEEEFGITVPASVDVRVMEDSPQAVHLVLPPEPNLSLDQLDQASGGGFSYTAEDWDPQDQGSHGMSGTE